mmetsp:Transcript_35915/g.93977  ORF Transcript_35915/g.93977 Transcript_35915/m.93977 type:complete len:118 (-) Transcript_35915:194-547(-)
MAGDGCITIGGLGRGPATGLIRSTQDDEWESVDLGSERGEAPAREEQRLMGKVQSPRASRLGRNEDAIPGAAKPGSRRMRKAQNPVWLCCGSSACCADEVRTDVGVVIEGPVRGARY